MIDFTWYTVCGYGLFIMAFVMFAGMALSGVFERLAKDNGLMEGDDGE